MILSDQLGIARAQRTPIGVDAEAEHGQRLAVLAAELASVDSRHVVGAAAEAGAERVEWMGEIGPARRRIGAAGGEGAGLAIPAAIGILGVGNLVRAHPLEIIIARIE